jgi:NADPH:quinone reductase-like Zn-dependent oxidoreductase
MSEGTTMKACHYHGHTMLFRSVHVGPVARPPPPGPGKLLVRVHSASLNPADWKSAGGEQAALLGFDWPRVFGFDFSGVVVAAGDKVPSLGVGARVFGMIRGLPQRDTGTLAELMLVDADVCARCPDGASHAQCAAVPLVAITAVKAFEACGLSARGPSTADAPGPRVLVTGGAGGVGSVAIQLAGKMFGACHVATTASAGAKTALCEGLGARHSMA